MAALFAHIFKLILLNENFGNLIQILLDFVSKGPIVKKYVFAQLGA